MSILFSPKTRQKTEKRVILSKKYVFLSIFLIKRVSFVVKYALTHRKRHCRFPTLSPFFRPTAYPWWVYFFRQDFGTDRAYVSSAAMGAGYPYIKIRARVATQFGGSD